ncbi:NucA/NucB deoxyribonuclease domain-containing protein [Amycolatopsis sp. 195334CR]|uniref:NucA/NucB deoxyribonuclease domain-containing protein n=1 Tax=Amycolatopsis sp. 195334CR TaxID=2814588 RepID=UPI001A8EFB6D|nr:NucA/NucB deoxyribonuclease domain-containing protein [Amycolatopsis sp. 195334CR]MBN6034094.1 hypothetical protein [Amycolatopsis sp. 195334CR]
MAISLLSGTPIASAGQDTLTRASVSDEEFLQVATESSADLCSNPSPEATRCITLKQPEVASATTASTAVPRSRLSMPQPGEINAAAEPDCEGFWRANSCVDVTWGYIVYEVINGVPGRQLGHQDLRFAVGVAWSWNSLSWSLRSAVKTTNASGTELPAGARGVISNGCAKGGGTVCDSGGGSYTVDLLTGVTHEQSWEPRTVGAVAGTTPTVQSLLGYVGPWMVVQPRGAPGSTVSLNVAEVDGIHGRCDNKVRIYPGCVAAENPAVITYDAIALPKVTEVAQHVYDAQASLSPYHWGWYGKGYPMKLGDAATEAANRAVACPTGGTPPGLSCDEFPIARSEEGAASGYPYSVRYVSPEANSSQGGQTSAYIGYSRILLEEEFWLIAFLPDGRTSWDPR